MTPLPHLSTSSSPGLIFSLHRGSNTKFWSDEVENWSNKPGWMLQLDDHDGCGVYLTWRILLCVLQRVWSFVNHLQHLKLKDYTLPFIFNWKMGHPGGPELVFLQQPYCYCWVECLNSAHACQHASIPACPCHMFVLTVWPCRHLTLRFLKYIMQAITLILHLL